ncbi:MAG TPA: hypothetical protein VMG30_17660 [Acidobacteriota bacterium]|nr:hypothetical protein [Acidobacteriota bacterium]
MRSILLTFLFVVVVAPPQKAQAQTEIDQAFQRMYAFDFPGMNAILDAYVKVHPEDPLVYSTRAIACLFSELQRMNILETDFFTDDDQVTDRKRLKPDPASRDRLFQMTGEARRRAGAILSTSPNDANAMFALCMAAGVETDYTILVEKRYIRSFSMSRESQKYAHRLLNMTPPVMDAYLTLGMVEYVVGSMNWFFRLFVHFDQIQGSKQKAVENLQKVVSNGRYYKPLAKILLSVIYLRNKQPAQALALLKEMERDYPENPLIRSEVQKVSAKAPRKI